MYLVYTRPVFISCRKFFKGSHLQKNQRTVFSKITGTFKTPVLLFYQIDFYYAKGVEIYVISGVSKEDFLISRCNRNSDKNKHLQAI